MGWGAALLDFITAFLARSIKYAGPWLAQALLFLGVNFATHTYAIGPLTTMIASHLAGTGLVATIYSALAAVQFDKAVSIILSAHITALSSRVLLGRKPVAP